MWVIKQRAKLEDQIDMIFRGEDATEVAHTGITVADAASTPVGFLLNLRGNLVDKLT